MMTLEELCKIRDSYERGRPMDVAVMVRDLISSHVDALIALKSIESTIVDNPITQGVLWLAYPCPPTTVNITRKSVAPVNSALGVAVFADEMTALRFANEADEVYRVTEVKIGQTIKMARYEQQANGRELTEQVVKEEF